MSSKHFSNDADRLVHSALSALTRTNPSLSYDAQNKIVFIQPRDVAQVALISGGGSGHEPAFGGLVGSGLLSAAVAGSIFASPSADQVRNCILHRVDGKNGILVIIMNYTGDCLHFGMAVEKAKAVGLKVELLVVGDDVGVGRSRNGRIGRRGIAGTVLVQKVAGAAAAAGLSLEAVHRVAELAAQNLVSVGASLAHVHVPGRGPVTDEMTANDEVEIGMGIHNEEGFGRIKADLTTVVNTMLGQLLDPTDKDRAYIHIDSSESVVLMVNNLGGISPLELGAVTEEVCMRLDEHYSIKPVRVLSGTYMTSLNGMGFSVSLLKIVETGMEISLLDLIDAPAQATGWASTIQPSSWSLRSKESPPEISPDDVEPVKKSNLRISAHTMRAVLHAGLQRLIAAEPDVTRYDTLVGDGDCGTNLKRGATAVLSYLSQDIPEDCVRFVSEVARIVETNMDGTSGAVYAIFLNALAYGLAIQDTSQATQVSLQTWATALKTALQSLGRYTPAQPGDRTLVDALAPFVDVLQSSGDLHEAATAAQRGSDSTVGMQASLGRTVYVGGDAFKACPDPGAFGLSEFLLGISEAT